MRSQARRQRYAARNPWRQRIGTWSRSGLPRTSRLTSLRRRRARQQASSRSWLAATTRTESRKDRPSPSPAARRPRRRSRRRQTRGAWERALVDKEEAGGGPISSRSTATAADTVPRPVAVQPVAPGQAPTPTTRALRARTRARGPAIHLTRYLLTGLGPGARLSSRAPPGCLDDPGTHTWQALSGVLPAHDIP